MGYKDLVESGASTPEMQSYLTDSELVTVTHAARGHTEPAGDESE